MTVPWRLVFRQLWRFSIIGVGNTLTDAGLYLWLTRQWHWHYALANVGAFLVANSCSFWLNRQWTFVAGPVRHQYQRFLLVSIIALLMGEIILVLGVQWAGISDLASKGIAIAVSIGFSFVAHRQWSFRHT